MTVANDLHILQHSLGVDQYGSGDQYRNHFVTGAGSVDWPVCNDLVERGLMTVQRKHHLSGGSDCFWVTDAGKKWVTENSPAPPKLTRDQKRYRDYLDSDGCYESFGAYLKYLTRKRRAEAML